MPQPSRLRRACNPASLAALLQARPRLLAFDFDGTLSPLASSPGKAVLPARVKARLRALSRDPQTTLAIVSGRALPILKEKIGLDGILYVGSHGATASRRGLGAPVAKLRRWIKTAHQAEQLLAPIAARYPGSLLENKGPDLSLHYRQVKPSQVRPLLLEAGACVSHLSLVLQPGKKVLEFKPRGGDDKGTALKRLASRTTPGWRRTGVCLYVGDDVTDEDAFSRLRAWGPRALGFKVGRGQTQAHFRLASPAQVETFLDRLVRTPCGLRAPKTER